MEEQKKELSATMATDTNKMKIWQKELGNAISNDWSNNLAKNQIPISMDKREKQLAKNRNHEN